MQPKFEISSNLGFFILLETLMDIYRKFVKTISHYIYQNEAD
ncbi:hypothetical protein SAMN04487909_101389 [Aneurinibacillus migulanus]|uniref:Uncharacterized protein n=1 Tax=Aneurinibacillus migulanus TaxID=47500 RepID=A0A1G8HGH1_ANEMI|nr:hypothetical protein SAMN04487909_101389 [Aneurinibacillus migulanus]